MSNDDDWDSVRRIVEENVNEVVTDNAPPCLGSAAEHHPRVFSIGYFCFGILVLALTALALYRVYEQPVEALTKSYEEAICTVTRTSVDSIICPENRAQITCFVAKVGVVLAGQNHTELFVVKPHSSDEAPFGHNDEAMTYLQRFTAGSTHPCWLYPGTEDVLLEPYEPPSAAKALWFPVVVTLIPVIFMCCLCYTLCGAPPKETQSPKTRAGTLGQDDNRYKSMTAQNSQSASEENEEHGSAQACVNFIIPLAICGLLALLSFILFQLWSSAITSLALGYSELSCLVLWKAVDRIGCPSDSLADCYVAKVAVRVDINGNDESEAIVTRPRPTEKLEVRAEADALGWISKFAGGSSVRCWAPENFEENVQLDDPAEVDVAAVMWLPVLATLLPCACACFVMLSCWRSSQEAITRAANLHHGSEREVYTEGEESYLSTARDSFEEEEDEDSQEELDLLSSIP